MGAVGILAIPYSWINIFRSLLNCSSLNGCPQCLLHSCHLWVFLLYYPSASVCLSLGKLLAWFTCLLFLDVFSRCGKAPPTGFWERVWEINFWDLPFISKIFFILLSTLIQSLAGYRIPDWKPFFRNLVLFHCLLTSSVALKKTEVVLILDPLYGLITYSWNLVNYSIMRSRPLVIHCTGPWVDTFSSESHYWEMSSYLFVWLFVCLFNDSFSSVFSFWNYHSHIGIISGVHGKLIWLAIWLGNFWLSIYLVLFPWSAQITMKGFSSRALSEERWFGSQYHGSQMREEDWQAQLPEYMCPFNSTVLSAVPWCPFALPILPGCGNPLFLFSREQTIEGREGAMKIKENLVCNCFLTRYLCFVSLHITLISRSNCYD